MNTKFEHDDQWYEEKYIELVWQLGDGLVDPTLDRVSTILAAAGKLPLELERDVADYVEARDERESLERIYNSHVTTRVDGFPISPRHDFPELLEALGKAEDDFFKDVLSEQIKLDCGY